ncbi:uncharacterized protein EV422DRAFT_28012 [Fimicolochytrium jonesii]|uniref:uncharacterized protein n=1 Tax=Fimicolochytrium jonesii TaxID=1396493 RepID=UPI0022FEA3B9|nr:uncharacterized protein EV422DRAFT_28012 [Fimicolochytrium jonesii]KAI8827147.1 hypothetical protein EV422DRAFT_28012 [Fimicolochytrium jonesii]
MFARSVFTLAQLAFPFGLLIVGKRTKHSGVLSGRSPHGGDRDWHVNIGSNMRAPAAHPPTRWRYRQNPGRLDTSSSNHPRPPASPSAEYGGRQEGRLEGEKGSTVLIFPIMVIAQVSLPPQPKAEWNLQNPLMD